MTDAPPPLVFGNAADASRDFRFPYREVRLEREGDFALFGPGVAHSYRSDEESLVSTVRWPSLAP